MNLVCVKPLASIAIARSMIKEAANIYNNERLHWSLDLKTPQEVHNGYNQQKYKSYKEKLHDSYLCKVDVRDGSRLC